MSGKSFILVFLLVFCIITLVWIIYDISKLPKDKQEENAGLIVMVTWVAPFLIVMLLLLTIKSISQDRAQERYYISRTKHESEKGIK